MTDVHEVYQREFLAALDETPEDGRVGLSGARLRLRRRHIARKKARERTRDAVGVDAWAEYRNNAGTGRRRAARRAANRR